MNAKLFLFVFSALVSYLVAGINPAILLSKMIYHQDIRTLGSKNPGFTNFKRVFGNRYAWYVFALDILKNLVLCLIFCPLFQNIMQDGALGAAYVGLCAMLGHVFPVWYHFQGGKGFLVGATVIWFIDWRVGLIAFTIWGILLFVTKYMSLSVIAAAVSCPVSLLLLGTAHTATWFLCLGVSLLMIICHRENIKRLLAGKESRFHLKGER